ncbi:MAG: transcriptional regulator, partial [Mycobacterium sp.]
RRSYRHADCGGAIGPDQSCAECGQLIDVADLVVHPPRRPRDRRDDAVSAVLRQPHRMLEPIHRA